MYCQQYIPLLITQQIDREKVETMTDFIFLGSKITVDGDISHETKTLDPWKKSYGKPTHHLADKGPYSQNYDVFQCHVWM